MTLRDKLAEVCPERVDSEYGGGAWGCPKDYDFLNNNVNCDDLTCTECWDLEYKPPNEQNETENTQNETLEAQNETVGSKNDPIKPDYYNDSKITPFQVIDDWNLDFYLGNAIKYIKRCGKKCNNTKLQDLRKAKEYIEELIRKEEKND